MIDIVKDAQKCVTIWRSIHMPGIADMVDGLLAEIARLRAEKAADWKAACDSSLAGTIEVGRLKAEIARNRLTDAEQRALKDAADILEDLEDDDGNSLKPEAATLRALLERLAKGGEK